MRGKNIWCLFAYLVFSLSTSGCAVTNTFGPYKGKVVDADTNEPIVGAVVYMKCSTVTGNAGGVQHHYADAKEVMTDKNGDFFIILTASIIRPGHLWEIEPSLIIFKPEYSVFPWNKKSGIDTTDKYKKYKIPEDTYVTVKLSKLATVAERKRNLGHIPLFTGEGSSKKYENLFRLINLERKNIGVSPISTPH